MGFHGRLYQGGRPNRLTKIVNAGWAWFHALGLFRNYLVTPEVQGRRSGKVVRCPMAMLQMYGERYLVSMLGNGTNWVRNVRAGGEPFYRTFGSIRTPPWQTSRRSQAIVPSSSRWTVFSRADPPKSRRFFQPCQVLDERAGESVWCRSVHFTAYKGEEEWR